MAPTLARTTADKIQVGTIVTGIVTARGTAKFDKKGGRGATVTKRLDHYLSDGSGRILFETNWGEFRALPGDQYEIERGN